MNDNQDLTDRVVRTVRLSGRSDSDPVPKKTIAIKLVSHANHSLADVEAALDEAVSDGRVVTDGDSYWVDG